MAATTTTRRGQGPRVRESAPAGARSDRPSLGDREQQYDLLTAALIGVVVGAGTTLLLRPRRRRVLVPGMDTVVAAGRAGRQGAKWIQKRGRNVRGAALDNVTTRAVSGFLRSARDRIDDAVESELRDLRKSLRRQRRRLGI